MIKTKQTIKDKKKKAEENDALVRFVCSGLYGFGCGTDRKKIASWRKEKTFKDHCDSFQRRKGD